MKKKMLNKEELMQKLVKSWWLRICLLVIVMTGSQFLGGCSGSGSLPTFDVSGNWFIYNTQTDLATVQGPFLFTFTQSQNDVSGTTPAGFALTGNVTDVNINFSWVGLGGVAYYYIGIIKANGTMSGTWTSSDRKSGLWSGIIETTPIIIAGIWDMFYTTANNPGEAGPIRMEFTQVGYIIKGTTLPGNEITVSGSVGSQSIIFFLSGSEGVTYSFSGTVTVNGTMSGTWVNSTKQAGTWRAVKLI